MIADNLAHIDRYATVHPRFASAFAFLKRLLADPDLKDGKHPMDPKNPDDLFANVQTYEPKPASEGALETHRNYIDLQFLQAGAELVYLPAVPAKDLTVTMPYDPGKDLAFYELTGHDDHRLLLTAGNFVIFFPGEAHGPSIRPDGSNAQVRKIVLKIWA